MHLPCDVEANDNFLCFENYYYLHIIAFLVLKPFWILPQFDVAIRKNDSFFIF